MASQGFLIETAGLPHLGWQLSRTMEQDSLTLIPRLSGDWPFCTVTSVCVLSPGKLSPLWLLLRSSGFLRPFELSSLFSSEFVILKVWSLICDVFFPFQLSQCRKRGSLNGHNYALGMLLEKFELFFSINCTFCFKWTLLYLFLCTVDPGKHRR